MSQVAAMLREASAVRARLRNPINAVIDRPINLKRREVIPIMHEDATHAVKVSTWDVFGPKTPSVEDVAFGPIVYPGEREEIPRTTVQEIQRAVCRYYRISRADMLSERRTVNIVRPRQVAMYLSKKLTLRSLPYIGLRFGGRDHTTVLHSVRKIAGLRLANGTLDAELAELEELFVASPSQTEDAACSSAPTTAT